MTALCSLNIRFFFKIIHNFTQCSVFSPPVLSNTGVLYKLSYRASLWRNQKSVCGIRECKQVSSYCAEGCVQTSGVFYFWRKYCSSNTTKSFSFWKLQCLQDCCDRSYLCAYSTAIFSFFCRLWGWHWRSAWGNTCPTSWLSASSWGISAAANVVTRTGWRRCSWNKLFILLRKC